MVYVAKDCQDEGDLETGTRVCRSCSTRKPMTEYFFTTNRKGRRRKCKSCVIADARALRAVDPKKYSEKGRWRAIATKYGLTQDDFMQMLHEQEGRCSICENKLTISTTHVDHDHKTNAVRGLLCGNCNVALGHLRDDPRLLDRAAAYLRRSAMEQDWRKWEADLEAELADLNSDSPEAPGTTKERA